MTYMIFLNKNARKKKSANIIIYYFLFDLLPLSLLFLIK